ncbi:MAG TPA: DUF1990 domain-containing protein [Kofleriaceae bacterium]|nr:DUF1990 domain-containing protein [Kofleriaceae bacterium]
MWHFSRPAGARVRRHLDAQRALPLTYSAVGATNGGDAPPGFVLDHNRQRLGRGEAVFARAREDVRRWRMFPAPWTAIEPAGAPIAEGEVVAVLIRALGVWWLNAARIVYVIDEPRRFGFAYGTLPGHVERGEERFLVEWLPDDEVWYDLRAFSRPRYWAVRLGRPIARALQRRFVRHSKAAMGTSHGAAR